MFKLKNESVKWPTGRDHDGERYKILRVATYLTARSPFKRVDVITQSRKAFDEISPQGDKDWNLHIPWDEGREDKTVPMFPNLITPAVLPFIFVYPLNVEVVVLVDLLTPPSIADMEKLVCKVYREIYKEEAQTSPNHHDHPHKPQLPTGEQKLHQRDVWNKQAFQI